jgi:hypothetical protein
MAWLKKQLYRLKVGACVFVFGIGLLLFIVHLFFQELAGILMRLGVVHCPDMIAKFGS